MPGEFYIEGKKEKADISQILAGQAELEGKLDHSDYGLAALKASLDALELKLDATKLPPYQFWASSVPIIKDDAGVSHRFAIMVSTIAGPPSPAEIVEGTISIWRVRSGALDLIVNEATCTANVGLIYYDYTFASDVWQEGDVYRALFRDQAVVMDGTPYPLPPVMLQGIVSETATEPSAEVMANWQLGEQNVITINSDGKRRLLHSVLLSIRNLVGTAITVRMYTTIWGVEDKVYEQTFDATADPPGLWIVNGSVGIREPLRITLQSNNAADNGKLVYLCSLMEGVA